jgi:hypothetical protein
MPTNSIYRASVGSTITPIQLGTFNAREFTIVVGAATELYVNQSSAPSSNAVGDNQSVVIIQPYSALTLTNTDPSTCWIRSHASASFYSVHWIT